ncbi:hypothetical protein JYQ29_10940 [Curtobacterium flaccumfaciens pv. flaccumfaciens]|uniref:SDH family Clp fold serine proteinase n=1 Tax=Curtobacterium flaccumfaciens TaxID=2035 RepID=UPI001ADD5CF7|nr:hypothetical protein [Curtobacterium flaccumfaciens]MBO9057499.1 hypothetical protein [Curtobacterium flaccumfaciens pv. flaccumfaciens]
MLGEMQAEWTDVNGNVDVDGMRRKYLSQLADLTGRNVVVYQTDWMKPGAGNDASINLHDVQGLMEVFRDLDTSKGLDLVLNSPGGDPTAADSLMAYMREKFEDVRVLVPVAAMSAATMWALAADRIVMGRHSQLGPVDPQLNMNGSTMPAGAITRGFARAQAECASDPTKLSAWVPTLQQYAPGLLELCEDASRLSKELVEQYLARYMFKDKTDRDALAAAAAEFFADDRRHIAHARRIGRDQLRDLSLTVDFLEEDTKLQDALLSTHHAYTHTFALSGAVKIIENHIGRTWARSVPMQMPMLPQMLTPGPSL